MYIKCVHRVNMICVRASCYGVDMENQAERLRAARMAAGYPSARSAAQKFDWKVSTYTAHENGQNGFDISDARKYGLAFSVNAAWLLGIGGPDIQEGKKLGKLPAAAGSLPANERPFKDELRRVPVEDEEGEGEPKKAEPLKTGPSIPEFDLRGGASYSGGMVDEDWNEGDVSGHRPVAQWGLPPSFVEKELHISFGSSSIIPVKGDSMDDGTIHALRSGDRVIVDHTDTDPRQGGIFAVHDGAGTIIKQVELDREKGLGQIVCKSLNTRYDPIPLLLDGVVRIIGRVAGKISRL